MLISYRWLNEYLYGKLPTVEKAGEILTMNSSEVESIDKIDLPVPDLGLSRDYILDVKVLPNMAHHCLCHRGIAKEFSALLDLPIKKYSRDISENNIEASKLKLNINIRNSNDCRRYIGRVVENIKIGPSPLWLKNRLEALGQRSINNLVDATNFVMLELGQPMHVFDADKIGGDLIEIKRAKSGDYIKTLDNKEIVLDEDVLVISNNDKALAIAGIKGGTLAEISEKTKNIILESANFNPVLIRRTAQKIKIQTDASKRYENDLSPEVAEEAMDLLTKLIIEIAGTADTKVGNKSDIYPEPVSEYKLNISTPEVEKLLGLSISSEEIRDIFRRLDFKYDFNNNVFTVIIPSERLDIRIKEDLIEEILKIYGYDKLKDNKKEKNTEKGQINKSFYYSLKIKKILMENGFSEIYGYTFSEKGEIELANSVAPDKKSLRNNLVDSMANYLEFNARYSELVDMPQIKIFEIGKVFRNNDEHNNFAIGVKTPLGNKNLPKDNVVLAEITAILEKELNLKLKGINKNDNIIEFNFDELVARLPEPKAYDVELPITSASMRFKKISIYPFSVRDVAVFVPEGTEENEIWDIIKKEAGDLLVKNRLFDVFTKKFPDGSAKTSYAFRLVLQSYDHTLSEEEISGVMTRITTKLNNQNGWQVR